MEKLLENIDEYTCVYVCVCVLETYLQYVIEWKCMLQHSVESVIVFLSREVTCVCICVCLYLCVLLDMHFGANSDLFVEMVFCFLMFLEK